MLHLNQRWHLTSKSVGFALVLIFAMRFFFVLADNAMNRHKMTTLTPSCEYRFGVTVGSLVFEMTIAVGRISCLHNECDAHVHVFADHAENYSPDDNRFDLRPFLQPLDFQRQFSAIDQAVATAAAGTAAGEADSVAPSAKRRKC